METEILNQRRRGPRLDVDVRSALIDTAEEWFGSEGVDAVSLRAVARAAGVAPAALTHHFRSKRDLLHAVVWRRGEQVATAIREGLVEVAAQQSPTPRDLVEAVLRPFVTELNQQPEAATRWMRIVMTLALAGDEVIYDQVASAGDVSDLFLQAAACVSELTAESIERRAPIAMFSMLGALAAAELGGYGSPIGEGGLDPEFVDSLAAFTAGGLAAR